MTQQSNWQRPQLQIRSVRELHSRRLPQQNCPVRDVAAGASAEVQKRNHAAGRVELRSRAHETRPRVLHNVLCNLEPSLPQVQKGNGEAGQHSLQRRRLHPLC